MKPGSQNRYITDAIDFLTAIFAPGDLVLLRPIETWTDQNGRKQTRVIHNEIQYARLGVRIPGGGWQFVDSQIESLLKRLRAVGERERANIFFGVCPRFGGGGEFDRVWQIRTARCLWSDLDGISPEAAVAKCDSRDVPQPSIVVKSGNGVHLYWLLENPVLFDDYESDPLPIRVEYSDQPDPKTGKRKGRAYIVEPTAPGRNGKSESKSYLTAATRPDLSPKAEEFQSVIEGLAIKIGGDHTHDATRLLRLPGTLNRKNERNGERPKPCEVWRI